MKGEEEQLRNEGQWIYVERSKVMQLCGAATTAKVGDQQHLYLDQEVRPILPTQT